jgi:putative oxidoreductase
MGFLRRFESAFYTLLRLVAGAMFAIHGTQKLFGFPIDAPAKIERFSQVWVGGVLELLCGVLIALGLFTRYAAFVASGMMAVAYFQFHKGYQLEHFQWMPLVNGGEPAALYCFVFLYIAAKGGGTVSIDRN